MTAKKGFLGGPFQLLISMIIFGMVLMIGTYLFENMQCWKCNELLKIQATNLREAISSVGKGDINSRKSIIVDISEAGACAEGIYLRKVTTAVGHSCRDLCPKHPNSCWVIMSSSNCGGEGVDIKCIDISSDISLVPIDALAVSMQQVTNNDEDFIVGSLPIRTSLAVTIEKVSADEIDLKPI